MLLHYMLVSTTIRSRKTLRVNTAIRINIYPKSKSSVKHKSFITCVYVDIEMTSCFFKLLCPRHTPPSWNIFFISFMTGFLVLQLLLVGKGPVGLVKFEFIYICTTAARETAVCYERNYRT